jgi:two-component system response regulator VicR
MNNKIILIEDDPNHVEIIKIILSEDGYEVLESLPKLLHENIEQEEPCLILLDNWLNQYSGAKICKDLKESQYLQHIPIILISASINLPMIAMDSKANGYIEKPFNIDTLSWVVRNTLELSH